MARRKGKGMGDTIKIAGFFRLQIVEDHDGKPHIVGDSGWRKNTVVNGGFANGIVDCLGGISGSSQITYAALGTGTAPGATDTTLNGEITDVAAARCAITPTNVSSKTLQCAFTLASGVYTVAHTIQNVGLFQTSTTSAGALYAGQTYATSQLQSNQSVQGSYQFRFS